MWVSPLSVVVWDYFNLLGTRISNLIKIRVSILNEAIQIYNFKSVYMSCPATGMHIIC